MTSANLTWLQVLHFRFESALNKSYFGHLKGRHRRDEYGVFMLFNAKLSTIY